MSVQAQKKQNPTSFTTSRVSKIRYLTLCDVDKAASTLMTAFRDDALDILLFREVEPKDRQHARRLLYRAYVALHVDKGIVLGINELDNCFETIAMWSTPTSLADGLEDFSALMDAGFGEVHSFCPQITNDKIFKKMMPLLHNSYDETVTTDERFTKKGNFTLVYVGSVPAAKGKGNVRKMFDFMFKKHIDVADNHFCYLESSSKANIPIYEKFGFRFYRDICLGEQGHGKIEGQDFAVMNIMIRDSYGRDWTKSQGRL